MQLKSHSLPKPCDTQFLGGTASDVSSSDTPDASTTSNVGYDLQLTKADLQRDDLSDFKVGPYLLAERIGYGGMGVVYKARHQTLGKSFAIKFISQSALQHAPALQRFEQEIFALGRLQHPHIINAVDAGTINGIPYYVTELLQGADLNERVRKLGLPPWEAACDLIIQSAEGLGFAHQQGFVHRDIKPSNIYLDQRGTIKLLDFGLVLTASTDHSLTTNGQLLGSIDYFSPEQAEDPHRCTQASDIYSLGAAFHFLLFGDSPFPDTDYPTVVSKVRGHLIDVPVGIRYPSKHLPEAVQRLLKQMLSKQVNDRPNNAEEIINALKPFANQQVTERWLNPKPPAAALDSVNSNLGAEPSQAIRKSTLAAFTGIIASALVLTGYILWQGSASETVASKPLPVAETTSEPIVDVAPSVRIERPQQVDKPSHNASVLQVDLGSVPHTSAALHQKPLRSRQP